VESKLIWKMMGTLVKEMESEKEKEKLTLS
jgi:hypothetical protein